ncbi:DUF2523 domain-containing protein [Duganella sp. PWIR1]
MPLLTALLGGLLTIASSMVGRVLLALGMSYVTYTGFDLAITWLLDQVKNNIAAMPSEIVSFMAWLWVDKAISMLFSAYTASIFVKLAGGSSLTKLITKAP